MGYTTQPTDHILVFELGSFTFGLIYDPRTRLVRRAPPVAKKWLHRHIEDAIEHYRGRGAVIRHESDETIEPLTTSIKVVD